MKQALILTEDTLQYPEGIDRILSQEAVRTGARPGPLTGGRHRHVLPVVFVTRNPLQIKIRSDQLTYRILQGLLDGKHFTRQSARGLAEYRQMLPKGRGSVSLALSPRSEESCHWWDDYRRQLWLFNPPKQSIEGL